MRLDIFLILYFLFLYHPWPFYKGDISHRGFSLNNGPTYVDTSINISELNWTEGVTVAENGKIFTIRRGAGGANDTLSLVILDSLGNILCRYDLGPVYTSNNIKNSAPVLDPESDSLIFIRYNSTIVALNVSSCPPSFVWSTPLIGTSGDATIVIDGGRLYANGTSLLSIDKNTGGLYWSVMTYGGVGTALSPGGDTVYTAYYDLYAISSSGNILWSLNLNYQIPVGVLTVGNDGTIYLPTLGGLMAVNPNGTIKWFRTDLSGRISHGLATSVTGDTIFIIYNDGSTDLLVALSGETGEDLWTFDIGDAEPSDPVVDSSGTVYVSGYSNGAHLYAISPDGSLKWQVDGVSAHDIAIGESGSLYISGEGTTGFKIIRGPVTNIEEKPSPLLNRNRDLIVSGCFSLKLVGNELKIFSINGSLLFKSSGIKGEISLKLNRGIYFVLNGENAFKVIVVK